jgi:release factor glutamine methyltransferase
VKTVRELVLEGTTSLQRLRGADPGLEAKVLLLKCASLTEHDFLASPDRTVPKAVENRYLKLIQRRLERWPLAYLTGEKEFWSLPLTVFPGVFIPRPETELLVERVKALSSGQKEIIAEIGTGSGALAIALAKELPRASIVATDFSRRAIRAAKLNASRHKVSSVTVVQGSLFEPLRALSLRGRLDFIVSNPPYVSEKDWRVCQPEIRAHEPKRALVPGKTGREFIGRLIQGAAEYLRPVGYLIFEIGEGQADRVLSLLGDRWTRIKITNDLAGIPRVVECRNGQI